MAQGHLISKTTGRILIGCVYLKLGNALTKSKEFETLKNSFSWSHVQVKFHLNPTVTVFRI